ncbi:hypothetical protein L208DRAFT_922578 [Tricholoma matsutake]|nr:hypothetical protein L208DRAFT_922578 [Tricholoma matsutake 945]
MNLGEGKEGCPGAVLSHPDGILVGLRVVEFPAGDAKEKIKVWILRARLAVYELSARNTAVMGLAWDAKHGSLYAVDRVYGLHGPNCWLKNGMGITVKTVSGACSMWRKIQSVSSHVSPLELGM